MTQLEKDFVKILKSEQKKQGTGRAGVVQLTDEMFPEGMIDALRKAGIIKKEGKKDSVNKALRQIEEMRAELFSAAPNEREAIIEKQKVIVESKLKESRDNLKELLKDMEEKLDNPESEFLSKLFSDKHQTITQEMIDEIKRVQKSDEKECEGCCKECEDEVMREAAILLKDYCKNRRCPGCQFLTTSQTSFPFCALNNDPSDWNVDDIE